MKIGYSPLEKRVRYLEQNNGEIIKERVENITSQLGDLSNLSTSKKDVSGAINEIHSQLDTIGQQQDELSSLTTSLVGTIDEVKSSNETKQTKTDNTLATTSKSVVGAINEVRTEACWDIISDKIFTSVSASYTVSGLSGYSEIKIICEAKYMLWTNITFNSDTTNKYHWLYTTSYDGTTKFGYESQYITVRTANPAIIKINNRANTNAKFLEFICGGSPVTVGSGSWVNTSKISSINFATPTLWFDVGDRIVVYGRK